MEELSQSETFSVCQLIAKYVNGIIDEHHMINVVTNRALKMEVEHYIRIYETLKSNAKFYSGVLAKLRREERWNPEVLLELEKEKREKEQSKI